MHSVSPKLLLAVVLVALTVAALGAAGAVDAGGEESRASRSPGVWAGR